MSDDKKSANELIGEIVTFLISAAMLPVMAVFNAVVVFKYWSWFVVPVFPSVPQPTILQCFGLLMTVNLFKMNLKTRDKTEQEKKLEWGTWRTLFATVFLLTILLLVGWLAHAIIYINPSWANQLLGM
jgi:hypothetical protein